MEHIFSDLLTKRVWPWLCLVVAGGLFLFAIVSPILDTRTRAFTFLAAYVALCLFLGSAVIKAALRDHRHLLTVCVWSFVAVLLGVLVVFNLHLALFASADNRYDRLLNVVPVFVAIWAAALGWLVHFRLTQRSHRTNNAFAIIMQTRTSSEFRARADLVSKHFPPGTTEIPDAYAQYFCPKRLGEALRESNVAEGDKAHAEAIVALKYVLNYYEFMAVGIRAGDLDNDMIYDTLHPSICNLYERSAMLIDYLRNPAKTGSDPTTYCDLKILVDQWKTRRSEADNKARGC
ncbi:DUF4760 domain-containing protein [Pseudoxanthomonas mexicana]|uniref:DUF4760 domain-containing protein n=1 Tax=Pseudoxanthomonas mexicana TaxID=128785 RepID=UPI0022F3FB63|nr:DUF4760 domain-containing protein [Pseudoxanthomonas mexicana]WBX94984.1 DUF4760 domain-containing protein [Pseudoxanthomonas mexicana]